MSVVGIALWMTLTWSWRALGAPQDAPASRESAASQAGDTPGLLSQMLRGPMSGVEEIVFAMRVPGRDHWYVSFGNYADDSPEFRHRAFKFEEGVYWGYGEGGRLCRLNLRTRELKVLLDDPKGGVRDPQVSYDGRKILFAYRRGGEHPFHLYEINADGSGLRQLTDGPDDDLEPTYCPDGSIVFCSSRCRRFVNCWHSRVATLHRCDANGRNIRMLSSNNEHDNTPWPMPDGRILYMRWEYVDRSEVDYHHLWTMNPDGSSQAVYHGNLHPGIAMLDAKPIPGSDKVVASFSPGHGRPDHLGYVTTVDPQRGPDALESARHVSQTPDWRDPWAFSEDCFLVAHKQGIYVMDGRGRTALVYQLPEAARATLECHEPRPLLARARESLVANRVDARRATGQLVLGDFYAGRKTGGLKRGTVKKLLVLKQLPKPVNFSGGMQPLTVSGTFTLAEILGTVPVEPDGSAAMEVPALESLFFVALDANDLAVKRMHSFLTVQPGETLSCVGCHEQRTLTLPALGSKPLAMRRPPSRIEPVAGVPPVIDFPRDVQPIFDRHCVLCHNPDRYEGRVDLTGDRTSSYSMSYLTMQTRGLVSDNRNRAESNFEPYQIGSSASRLMRLIDGSHHQAKLTEQERTMLRLWIDTSATYPGTYAALGCGTYRVPLPQGDINHRCAECHLRDATDKHGKPIKRYVFGNLGGPPFEAGSNLSRPEKSLLLLAPLAKASGGLGLCSKTVFADTQDKHYREILAAVRTARESLLAGKRFDMPGFRPNKDYLREMQRFGFLPKDLAPETPINHYAVDRAYWDSFVCRP